MDYRDVRYQYSYILDHIKNFKLGPITASVYHIFFSMYTQEIRDKGKTRHAYMISYVISKDIHDAGRHGVFSILCLNSA